MSGSPTVPEGAAPRRPLKTRQRAWAQALARALTRAGIAPNAISMASLVFATAAGLCLGWTGRADRFADVVILVGTGYSIAAFGWGRELGWLAAVLAVMTAYIRLLGGSMGVP